MHIKTGTWESNNAACETDALCDPAVLVSTTANSEPHIRNRRLSPGSGNGGGGGGCTAGVDQQQQQTRRVSPTGTPEGDHPPSGPGGHHASSHHPFAFRGEKEQQRRGQQQQRRGGQRREAQRGAGARAATNDRPQKLHQKERWVGDSLSLLKPPPAFPVQDSPAKLQPAVSYASKVKSGATGGGALEEDPPAIGVLLQNQWGLSFISEARPPAEGGRGTAPCPSAASAAVTPPPTPPTTDATESTSPPPPPQQGTCCAAEPLDEVTVVPAAATSPVTLLGPCPEEDDSNGKLLLSCRHLVEALKYHTREWNAVCNKQKDPKNKVVWYKDPLEQPA